MYNDLLQRDLGVKPIISNFVELLPKFGYFFLLIIVHVFPFISFCFRFKFVRVTVKWKKNIYNNTGHQQILIREWM